MQPQRVISGIDAQRMAFLDQVLQRRQQSRPVLPVSDALTPPSLTRPVPLNAFPAAYYQQATPLPRRPFVVPQPVQTRATFCLTERIGQLSELARENFQANLAEQLEQRAITVEKVAQDLEIQPEIVKAHFVGRSFIDSVSERIAHYFNKRVDALFVRFQREPSQIDPETDAAPPTPIQDPPTPATPGTPNFLEAVSKLAALNRPDETIPSEPATPATPNTPSFLAVVDELEALKRVEDRVPDETPTHQAPPEQPNISRDESRDDEWQPPEIASEDESDSEYQPSVASNTASKKKKAKLTVERAPTPPEPTPPAQAEEERLEDTSLSNVSELFPELDQQIEDTASLPQIVLSDNASESDYQPSVVPPLSSDEEADAPAAEQARAPAAQQTKVQKNVKKIALERPEMERFVDNFKLLRRARGYGKESAALLLGCSPAALHKLEQKKHLKSKLFSLIPKVFDISLKQLLSRTFKNSLKISPSSPTAQSVTTPPRQTQNSRQAKEQVLPLSKRGKPLDDEQSVENSEQPEFVCHEFLENERILIGQNLKWLRNHHNLKRSFVANQIGCKKISLRRIEKGERKKSRFYSELERFYKTGLDTLRKETFIEDYQKTPSTFELAPKAVKKLTIENTRALWPRIGSNLKKLREHSDVKILRLATLLEVDRRKIRRCEAGEYIDPEFLERILDRFDVGITDIELEPAEFQKKLDDGAIRKMNFDTPYMAKRKACKETKQYCEAVSKNFAYLRKKKDVSFDTIQVATGVSKFILCHHEHGEWCDLAVVDALAKYFGKSREDLLDKDFINRDK